MESRRVKIDLHVHTRYSYDSLTTLRDVLRWAERRGLDGLAITDHNSIEGAVALAEISPIPIIVGEEIRTTHGEVIGLFLQSRVPGNLSPEETVRIIHDQGGVVCVPHPLDRVRHSALEFDALLDVIEEADAVEALNARVTFAMDNRLAEALARAYQLPQAAGSDAHQGFEIGHAYVEMDAWVDPPSFLQSLSHSRIFGRISSPFVHVGSTCAKMAKVLMPSAPFAR